MTALRTYLLRLLWGPKRRNVNLPAVPVEVREQDSTLFRYNRKVMQFFNRFISVFLLALALTLTLGVLSVQAQGIPQIDLSVGGEEGDLSLALQALIIVTILSFGPAFVTMMTSFTRIIVVFFFLRMGLGTQQSPPNQVLIGLALFYDHFYHDAHL